MRLTLILLLLLCVHVHVCYGQTGFEDSNGKSSLILVAGGVGKVNVVDKSLNLGYVYRRSPGKLRFGAEISGKVSEGIGTLFDEGDLQPETSMRLSIGWDVFDLDLNKLDSKPRTEIESRYSWLTMSVGYKRARFNLFRENEVLSNQFIEEGFDGWSGMIYYNHMPSNGNALFGLSAGVERQNNILSLAEVEVIDRITVFSNEDTTRISERVTAARQGEYAENWAFITNLDLVWIPSELGNRIGFDLFGRLDTGKEGSEVLTPGIGVFITEAETPTRVVGGMSFEFESFDPGKLRVGLIVGFKF